MNSPAKKPRRTAERILDVALELFNRFGEPNVSTTVIAAELGISPGNLYYHYPAKDELINSLVARFEGPLDTLLGAAADVRNVEDAWLVVHMLFEHIWQHRFLYRDLNDLLSKNRHLELRFQRVLQAKREAIDRLLTGLGAADAVRLDATKPSAVAGAMVVVLTYWLSYEYVRDPRHALEPESAAAALVRGAFHVLCLLRPYLKPTQMAHLDELLAHYGG